MLNEPIALLGLGAMGAPMARSLARRGAELTVWNRSPQRAEGFAELGATVAATPADAARGIVLTVLPDLDQVEDVLEGESGLRAGWRRAGITDPVLVVHGTVSPVAVSALAERLAPEGIRVVDAPLSGGVRGAAEARLSIMCGGAASDVERVRPFFDAMGSVVRHLGPTGAGSSAKLCNQVIVAATVTAVSEAMLLARRAGLDLAVVRELLEGGLANSELLRQKAHHWIDETYEPGGQAGYQLKDLRFAQQAASSYGVVLPLTHQVELLFEAVDAAGESELDHTVVYRAIERLSGGGRADR